MTEDEMAGASEKAAGRSGKWSPQAEIGFGHIPASICPEVHWKIRGSAVSKGNLIKRMPLGVLGNGV